MQEKKNNRLRYIYNTLKYNFFHEIHNQATKCILHIIQIVDILSVLFRGINDIVYKNDCNDEQRYRNV